MKKFLIQTVLLTLVIGAGIFFFSPQGQVQKIDLPFLPQQPKISSIQINDAIIQAEVVDTASKRAKGLGGRQSLAESEGMLFIFPKSDKYPFWMKGLNFPLDFVWILDDKVVDVLENIPPPAPNQPDSSLPIYSSKVEINKVLEVNAGTIKKFNIKAGDSINIK